MNNHTKLLSICIFLFFSFSSGISQGNLNSVQANTKSGFNYGVKSLKFKKVRNGKEWLKIETYLTVNDKSNKTIIMNHDVQVYKNGRLIKTFKQNARKDSALKCAVTCKGTCPSILKTGKCVDCKCDYSNYLSANPKNPRKGDRYEVKIVSARRGIADAIQADNSKSLIFPSRN